MTDKPGNPANPTSFPEQRTAAAGLPTGSSLRPDPAGHGDPHVAPGEAAGDFTLRPDPLGLHDPRPHGGDPRPAEAASAVKEGVHAASERAADLAGQARETVTGLASDIQERLGGAADQVRERAAAAYDEAQEHVGAIHKRNMRTIDDLTVKGIDGLQRGRSAVERFVDDNPLLVGVVGVAAGLLLGALLPRTRQEDRNIGPWADEVRDQGLRYAREVTSMGREFVQTALDPDNLNAAVRKVADADDHMPPASERTAHNL
ncbi:hypothetical protein [Methylobacterium sp. NEAU K]|uniref:hypothetical protein n=1 Tax=Methylobacterium sp. NEAU K TaxID=3064946 RepID=UPI002735E488|nr:hypothetical protein [Methylobacterium sp. NEAU K]MDP4005797.1 hypothetical protein [Methylobacterium sp. NEAU K]